MRVGRNDGVGGDVAGKAKILGKRGTNRLLHEQLGQLDPRDGLLRPCETTRRRGRACDACGLAGDLSALASVRKLRLAWASSERG